MAWIRAAAREDLERERLMELVRGDDRYAICWVAGEIHAIDGTCPHVGGPLGQGALHGRTLVCPWHAWEFDCVTGESEFRSSERLRKFAVEVRGDEVYLDLP